MWFDYFDLGRDYRLIKEAVMTDGIMEKAVNFGSGIRILRQEPWETLVSFILSANNRIPRIMKIISEISRLFGTEIRYAGNHTTASRMHRSLRCKASSRLPSAGRATGAATYMKQLLLWPDRFDTERLATMQTADARKELMKYKGVGGKVADCVLLYSGIKYDVFPVDVWVKRVMEELYFGREAGFPEIHRFASEKFGQYAGFAQQYLFYYAREHKIGI